MKYLAVLLLWIAPLAMAQNGAFTLISACYDANGYQLQIEASSEVQRLDINPSHGAIQEWAIDGELSHHFTLGLDNEWAEIRAYLSDSQPIQMLDLSTLGACANEESETRMTADEFLALIPMDVFLALIPRDRERP